MQEHLLVRVVVYRYILPPGGRAPATVRFLTLGVSNHNDQKSRTREAPKHELTLSSTSTLRVSIRPDISEVEYVSVIKTVAGISSLFVKLPLSFGSYLMNCAKTVG